MTLGKWRKSVVLEPEDFDVFEMNGLLAGGPALLFGVVESVSRQLNISMIDAREHVRRALDENPSRSATINGAIELINIVCGYE